MAGKVLAGILAAFVLTLSGQGVVAADDVYTIIVKKVEVQQTKANGEPWDINGGKPDISVQVRNASEKDAKSFATEAKADSFAVELNMPTTVKFRAGQQLEIEVVDADAAVNDSIGKMQKEMNADVLKEGKLKLEKFGQVISLELEIKKL